MINGTKTSLLAIFSKSLFLKNRIIDKPIISNSIISFIDQSVISAANFTVNLLLLKNLALADYGRFSVFFSLLLFFVAVHGSIITTPTNVLVAGKTKNEADKYLSSLLIGQFFVFAVIAILGLGFAFILPKFGQASFRFTSVCFLMFACFGTILREFFKPVFFNRPRAIYILIIDVVYVLIYLSALLGIFFVNDFYWLIVFALIGVAALFAGVLGIYFWKPNFVLDLKSIKRSLLENLNHGRWTFPSVIIANISIYSFLYLLIYLLGEKEAGIASASRLTIMPILLGIQSWSKVLIPQGAKLRVNNQINSLIKILLKASVIFVLGILSYVFFFSLVADNVVDFLFGSQNINAKFLIFLWMIYACVFVIRQNLTSGLLIFKEFKILFFSSILMLCSSLILGYFLIVKFQIAGSIVAMIGAESVLLFFSLYYFIISKNKHLLLSI